ncbi:MAG TPA: hypothetical protein VJS69_06695 [Candidatus Krumholzibacteria bacterium]|nr:hypothetical protein [Candidatus Krumholzibacteria bacterium]
MSDDDMPEEIDFSGGVRGKYARRLAREQERFAHEVLELTLRMLAEAEIRDVIIYCYLVTERILTQETYEQLPRDDQAEWDGAYDDFEWRVEQGAEPSDLIAEAYRLGASATRDY